MEREYTYIMFNLFNIVQLVHCTTSGTLYLTRLHKKGKGGTGRNVSGEKRGLEGEEGNSQGGEKGFGRGKWKVKGKCVKKERRRMGRGK